MIKCKKSSSSKRWLVERCRDQYVQKVRETHVRSRAWFKLDQINRVDYLFASGMVVVDLGSAPGGWSKYAMKKIGKHGRVISCDILPMSKIIGVDFVQGDLRNPDILSALILQVQSQKVDIILSDMCPNITGISSIDIPRLLYLNEIALDLCKYILISGGSFLVKVFQGIDFNKYCRNVRTLFNFVKIRKPDASYAHSREMYIVAREYKM